MAEFIRRDSCRKVVGGWGVWNIDSSPPISIFCAEFIRRASRRKMVGGWGVWNNVILAYSLRVTTSNRKLNMSGINLKWNFKL